LVERVLGIDRHDELGQGFAAVRAASDRQQVSPGDLFAALRTVADSVIRALSEGRQRRQLSLRRP
jgi:hypothetical protein